MKKFQENLTIFLASALFIFLLTSVWFKGGHVIAAGEAGIFFYNFKNILRSFGHTWFTGAIGFPGTGLPLISLPFFSMLSLLYNFGISYVTLQHGLFFALQLTGFLSVYFIASNLFNDYKRSDRIFISLTAALFYIFNQINIVLILNRMQYSFLFSYALYPLGLLIVMKAIQKKQMAYSIVLVIISVILSMSFSALPSTILFWLILFLFAVSHLILYERNVNSFLFVLKFFSLTVFCWLLVNSWWIFPMISTIQGSPYITNSAYNPSDDLQTLLSISNALGNLSYIFRLMHHDFYWWKNTVWGNYFQKLYIILLTFSPTFIAFGTLLLKKKFRYYSFFMCMLLVTMFLMKGSANPFGEVFKLYFIHVRAAEGFRNPFEKIGISLPLFFSIPFAYGVFILFRSIKERISYRAAAISIGVLFLTLLIICLPLINGNIFTSNEPPLNNPKVGYQVLVPKFYEAANAWLNSQRGEFRVIALPIGGEGITYTWKYGYAGVEMSNGIFDRSFISYCTTIQYLCPITNSLEPLLINYPQDFWKIMESLNARYIMVRKDVDIKTRDLQVPDLLENKLQNAANFQKDKTFGKLTFYSLSNKKKVSEIFPSDNGIYFDSDHNAFISAIPLSNYKEGDVYFTDSLKSDLVLAHSKQIILESEPIHIQQIQVNKANAVSELPYVKYLPGQKLYTLIKLKEWLQIKLAGSNLQDLEWTFFDKRLVEVYQLVQNSEYNLAKRHFSEYKNELSSYAQKPALTNTSLREADLLRQKYVLEEMIHKIQSTHQSVSMYKSSLNELNDLLIKLNVLTLYPANSQKYNSYIVSVPKQGVYQLELDTRRYNDFFDSDVSDVRIDGNNSSIQISPSSDFTSLITMSFTKGKHQIDILKPNAKNLVKMNDFTMIASSGEKTVGVAVNPFDSYYSYNLNLQYKLGYGNPPQAYVYETKTNGNTDILHFLSGFSIDKNKWLAFSDSFTPSQLAKSNQVDMNIWTRTCTALSGVTCKQKINRTSKVEIKNVTVTRNDVGNLFLVLDKQPAEAKLPEVNFQKINPAKYIVSVTNASSPYFLNFLESYHPLWKAYYLEGNRKIQVTDNNHILINSYANSWYIIKKGNYKMEIEFLPEESFKLGKWISGIAIGVSILGLILYGIINLKRKYAK